MCIGSSLYTTTEHHVMLVNYKKFFHNAQKPHSIHTTEQLTKWDISDHIQ